MRIPYLGVPIMRNGVFGGPPLLGNYHSYFYIGRLLRGQTSLWSLVLGFCAYLGRVTYMT